MRSGSNNFNQLVKFSALWTCAYVLSWGIRELGCLGSLVYATAVKYFQCGRWHEVRTTSSQLCTILRDVIIPRENIPEVDLTKLVLDLIVSVQTCRYPVTRRPKDIRRPTAYSHLGIYTLI